MENNRRAEETDLDLNQQLLEPSPNSMLGFGSLLDDIDTVHGRIEERIRHLEEVTTRARQRQRWRQVQTIIDEPVFGAVAETSQSQGGVASMGRSADIRKNCKRDHTHLIAKALETDASVQNLSDGAGGFYDCNICLDGARDPILTCCGHLFCWPCFYQLPQDESDAKECPVCKGEVKDNNIIPIYGNGGKAFHSMSEASGSQIPPRPHARRIESMRQHQVTRGLESFRIEEVLRRVIHNRIGPVSRQIQAQDLENAHATSEGTSSLAAELPTSHVSSGAEAEGSRGSRVLQFSRLLSEEAASLSSLSSNLSSALSSAERIVENLEEIVHLYPLRSRGQLLIEERNSVASIVALMHAESSTLETGTGINPRMPPS